MSIWRCDEHGITAPMGCCGKASRVERMEPVCGAKRSHGYCGCVMREDEGAWKCDACGNERPAAPTLGEKP